jgi:putative membrane protein
VDRTLLAYDRTLLAWIRTAIVLITFGFTINKFFQLELSRVVSRSPRLIGPPEFAFLMILIGLVSLLLATLDYRKDIKALRARYPGASNARRTAGSDGFSAWAGRATRGDISAIACMTMPIACTVASAAVGTNNKACKKYHIENLGPRTDATSAEARHSC